MKLFLILCLMIVPCFAQERFAMPVDEAAKDTSFLDFRTKLIAAVKKHDVKFVLSVTDKNIKIGFGGDDGIENFKKQWKINSSNSQLWKELLTVLTHGGAFQKGNKNSFFAPYLFTNFPEDIDAFEYQAIFGNNVNLRSQPDVNSKIVVSLSYNIVKVDYQNSLKSPNNEDDILWLKVETLGGKKGYVKPEFVRSSIGYRAGFVKKRGKWILDFFLAGD